MYEVSGICAIFQMAKNEFRNYQVYDIKSWENDGKRFLVTPSKFLEFYLHIFTWTISNDEN